MTRAAEDALARAEAAFAQLPRLMEAEVKLGAVEELTTKTYQDRTRNARKSTKGYINRRGANEVEVVLEAGAEYASFLRGRGFSNIDEVARDTAAGIQGQIDALGERVTGR